VVQSADVFRSESMIRGEPLHGANLRQLQRLRFSFPHVAHSRNPQQVTQDAASGTRLKLSLETNSVVLTNQQFCLKL